MRASYIRTACTAGVFVALGVMACSFGPATYNGPNVPPAPVDSGASEDAGGGDGASEDSGAGEDVSSEDSGSGEDATSADSGGGLDGSAG